jgi:hypothetical protein
VHGFVYKAALTSTEPCLSIDGTARKVSVLASVKHVRPASPQSLEIASLCPIDRGVVVGLEGGTGDLAPCLLLHAASSCKALYTRCSNPQAIYISPT